MIAFDTYTKIIQTFGQICCQRLKKVAQNPINRPIWSHCLLLKSSTVDKFIFLTYHEVPDHHGGQEEGDANLGRDDHAVPHGLDPLAAQDPEHDHEAVHEVGKVPPGHVASPLVAYLVEVVLAEELHAHDGKDEDDDAQDERQVGQRADRVRHDGENVVQRLPRFGELEDSQQTEGPEHGQAFDALCQQLDEGQDHDEEVETVPSVLKEIFEMFKMFNSTTSSACDQKAKLRFQYSAIFSKENMTNSNTNCAKVS